MSSSVERDKINHQLTNEIFDRLIKFSNEPVRKFCLLNLFLMNIQLSNNISLGSTIILSTFANHMARTRNILSIVSNYNESNS